MELVVCYVTCGSVEEAERIGRALVERHQAACVNIVPRILSLYRWEGAVQRDEEVLLLAKTRRELVDAVVRTVRALHSYELPCVTALPILDGHRDYLVWVAEETAPAVEVDGPSPSR